MIESSVLTLTNTNQAVIFMSSFSVAGYLIWRYAKHR
jgi:hypothetical protein